MENTMQTAKQQGADHIGLQEKLDQRFKEGISAGIAMGVALCAAAAVVIRQIF